MNNTKLETDRRYFLEYRDGMVDIFIGLGILFAGLFLVSDMPWMAGIFIPLFLPSWKAARERLHRRRSLLLENDPFSRAQGQKVLLSITLLIGTLVLVGIGALLAPGLLSVPAMEWLRAYFLVGLGGIFAIVWAIAALVLKVSRFNLYAIFTFVLLAMAQFTNLPFWASLAIAGGSIMLAGMVVLLRFIQEHPLLGEGM
jgi:hypothetical protein